MGLQAFIDRVKNKTERPSRRERYVAKQQAKAAEKAAIDQLVADHVAANPPADPE